MRILLILLLLVPVILIKVRSQEPADGPPDLQIGEYSSSKFRTYGSASDYGIYNNSNTNKADPRSRDLIYREEIRNRNSIENRSRDMLELEQSVRREAADAKQLDLFRYRVSLKNTGAKIVKSVFWDYQVSNSDDFSDVTHRQFRCSAKIKPNENERFEGFSGLPPSRVVTASGETFKQRVVINRIEYADGTFWQRSEWREPEIVATRGGRGNCRAL
jgi:hypothetical protein